MSRLSWKWRKLHPLKQIASAAHVADSGYVVGNIQRIDDLLVPGRGYVRGVHVHIPQPWNHGIKSAKAIVKIEFTENQPINTWNEAAPSEYGFLLQM